MLERPAEGGGGGGTGKTPARDGTKTLRLTLSSRLDQQQHALQLPIIQHIRRRKPQHPNPLLTQASIPLLVPRRLFRQVVHIPIDLNAELVLRAVETEHIWPDRMLPPEPHPPLPSA